MINLLYDFLEKSSKQYPEKDAIVTSEVTVTFTKLNESSDSVRNYLHSVGVKKGDRVGIFLGNTADVAIAFWGILKAGAVAVPLAAELKENKLKYILNDSAAVVLFTKNELLSLNGIDLSTINSLKKVVLCDLREEAALSNFYVPIDIVLGHKERSNRPEPISVDLSSIIYTSGSTGEPKGVMHTHQSMVTATNSLNAYLGYNKEDKVLCALPLTFDYGLYQMIMSVSTGATLLLEKEFTWPIFLLKKIASHKATIFPIVPTMLMMVYEQAQKKSVDLSSIRAITNTGAALTLDNIQMAKELFSGTKIFSMYGLTECKRCTYLPPEFIDSKPGSVGIAIPNTELWLIDDQGEQIHEPGKTGQLVIRGATVMKGYWNKPEKTAEKLKDGHFPGEKVLHTGDHCYLDTDGFLYFQGRMDSVIKTRGMKVSPKEVEDCINTIPEVHSCSIVGISHTKFGEALFAFVTLNENSNIEMREIREFCRTQLEDYKIPEHIQIISNIPRTANGKFDTLKLEQEARIVCESGKVTLTDAVQKQ